MKINKKLPLVESYDLFKKQNLIEYNDEINYFIWFMKEYSKPDYYIKLEINNNIVFSIKK